ncbi:MAG TPA: hypothetical protein PLM53_10120 [Spirochaetota bacterium]|nr:hypothetical protein [Spirochaetota bacterium]HPC41062.1 hypothetical protein [Spirochaetota bacterium]HPL18792.1 hypothetical protein [Spirochaetota bacterium]HQF08825.1 hypothetical protein [Spirochaetota bacterium]HQH97444.1 hypothetical protein [Spirochaetota bacterium]
MTEQYDSLGEKTKQVDMAMKYTRGDILKAKEMASGQYLDVMVVKGKFLVENKGVSGVFLAFFNYIQEYIANVTCIMSSKSSLYEKTRVFDDWKSLSRDLQAFKESSDIVDSQNFTYFLIDSFVGYDVFPDVQERNLDDLTRTVSEIIGKSFNAGTVKCQIELEPTSSLAMELAGVRIDIPGMEGQGIQEIVAEDERITMIESEAKFVIEGTAVLSPVKGKNVNDLISGDKIRVILTGKDMVSEKILRLLGAYDAEGARQPITGRIKAKVPFEKGGYILYALVAKGVLAKIFEEENVKLMIDQPQDDFAGKASELDNRIFYIIAVVVGLIIVCGIILFLLL